MADIDRGEFVDCDLRQADFYAATVRRTGFLGCDLTGAEFSKAVVTALRLERTTVYDLGGIGDLRDSSSAPIRSCRSPWRFWPRSASPSTTLTPIDQSVRKPRSVRRSMIRSTLSAWSTVAVSRVRSGFSGTS